MRVRRFFGFVLGGLSGRASSDVCMGEGSQILIRFGGGCGAGCRPRCRMMNG